MRSSEERLLFQADRLLGFRRTKLDIQGEIQFLARQVAFLNVEQARDRLVRTAGIAGADPWAIPEHLCSDTLRQALRTATDLGLRPQGRTSTKTSRTLMDMAKELTESTDLEELATVLAELGRHPPDMSPDVSQSSEDLDGFLADFG